MQFNIALILVTDTEQQPELGLDYLEVNAFPRSPDHPPPLKIQMGPSSSIDMLFRTDDGEVKCSIGYFL